MCRRPKSFGERRVKPALVTAPWTDSTGTCGIRSIRTHAIWQWAFTYNDVLPAAGHGANGVPYTDLGGLVKDHHIEQCRGCRQVLRYGEWAHQQARRELSKRRWKAGDQLT